jgi:hypothetical protein
MSMTGAPIPECLPGDPGDNCQPVAFEILCDDFGPFLRRYQINCDTGSVIGISDTELDGVTAYATIGAVVNCGGDADVSNVRTRTLCDTGNSNTNFIRTEVLDAGGNVIATVDTEVDGVTPYVVVGPVDFECCQGCEADAYRQHREELVGAGVWARPAGASAVTVKCRALDAAGSATITDASAVVTPLFIGDEETWASPDGTPLSGAFTVTTTGAGDYITIFWLETA